MSRINTTYSSNYSFHFFLETALHATEEHNDVNLKLSATLIIIMFIVTRVRIVKYDQFFNNINTNRSTT